MRHVYNRLNLHLSRLIVLYLLMYVLYIYTPAELVLVRQITSYGLLVALITTIIAAVSLIFAPRPKTARKNTAQTSKLRSEIKKHA